jgi:hypothetical protein
MAINSGGGRITRLWSEFCGLFGKFARKTIYGCNGSVEAGIIERSNGYSPRQKTPAAPAVELGDSDAWQMIKPALLFPELKE